MRSFVEPNASAELKGMLPYILIFDGAVTAVCVVIGLVSGFDWRLYTGLVVGNALMLANFLLIGYTAKKILQSRDFRRGKLMGNLSYGLRYIGIFVILAALLTFGLVSLPTAVIPLFYPKIYYTFFYLKTNSHEEDEGS